MADRAMKAYEISEPHEGNGCVIFATNGATARRQGANELGINWEDVEQCRRAPHLDQYAPGPVSPLILIEHGWWFECDHCGRRVNDDMADELADDGLDPADFVPRLSRKDGVFCSATCECHDHMTQRDREEAEDALREVFEAKFPTAEILHIHVYGGPKLESPEDPTKGGGRFVVTFKFPGGQYSALWNFGDDRCWVSKCDQDAFTAWQDASKGVQQ